MDKLSYSLGLALASNNLLQTGIKNLDYESFKDGVKDVMTGSMPKITAEEANKILQTFFKEQDEKRKKEQKELGVINKQKGDEFLKENAKKDGVITTASGLQYKVIKEGTGKSPVSHSRVRCHYEGTLIDGTKFDSSYDRKTPADFGLNQVIPGWTEGLQLMKEGGTYMFYIPYQLGYGEVGMNGHIPPCSTLVFKVELIKVL